MIETLLAVVGRRVLSALELAGGLTNLLIQSILLVLRGAVSIKLTIEQMSLLGVDSFLIVLITTTFTGMVLAFQLSLQALKYGLESYVGAGVAISMAREFAPMLTAIVVAGRGGSAIAAQLGSMKVTEQIDALKALATNPVEYLVVPRFLACIFMVPMLSFFSFLGGVWGGYFISITQGINPIVYKESIKSFFFMSDIWGGLIKAVIYGALVAIVGCYLGLTTEGGAAGVGRSTTNSVVLSTVLIFIFNFPLTILLFGEG